MMFGGRFGLFDLYLMFGWAAWPACLGIGALFLVGGLWFTDTRRWRLVSFALAAFWTLPVVLVVAYRAATWAHLLPS